MIKRLTRHGNSLALVIDRGVLDLLKIDEETPISISTDGRSLVLTPVPDPGRKERFRKAVKKVTRRYARAFRRLAE